MVFTALPCTFSMIEDGVRYRREDGGDFMCRMVGSLGGVCVFGSGRVMEFMVMIWFTWYFYVIEDGVE